MQMIDVLKRLAQLDAKNSKVVKEGQVQECGPMGMMDGMPGMSPMGLDKPSVPANFSINASAATGNEVADMMSQILTLAGMKQVGAGDLGAEPVGAVVTDEPVSSVGPMAAEPMPSAADDMRSVLDKLNPEPAGDEGGEELGPFQHDSDKPEGGEDDGAAKPEFGNDDSEGDQEAGDEDDEEEETDEGQYDNSPADTNSANPFDSNEFANQENQPGSGDTSKGEKRQSNLPTATFEALMKQYKQFIGESEEEEDMEEGIEDRLKDLDPKNPVNIPAYQRKAKSGDSAEHARNTKEGVDESCSTCHKDPCECSTNESLDILKLAGLK
jgi:hypothetical protein